MNISTMNRNQLSRLFADRAAALSIQAITADDAEQVRLNSLAGVGQRAANYCCESAYTLKALRKMAREYLNGGVVA